MSRRRRSLYMEERLALVRKGLNEGAVRFRDLIPDPDRFRFQQYVLDLLHVVDGDPVDSDALVRLDLEDPRK